MFAKALHRISHRLLGMGWRRWWSVVHGSRAADARAELGMAHDALAQREYALKQYNKVLAMNEYDNSHSIAERYKKRPYRR